MAPLHASTVLPSPFAPARTPALRPPPAPHPAPTERSPPCTAMTAGARCIFRPKLRLEIQDLSHSGAAVFLNSVQPSRCVAAAVATIAQLLYPPCSSRTAGAGDDGGGDTRAAPGLPPSTRSITLILRHMPGVAHATASDLDPDHKEVHLSLAYLARIPPARATDEITGILTHEPVHCFQHDARGSCPAGLVEGIADWVRLRCSLAPPHWSRQPGDGPWDAGYHSTTYFLEYLDARFARRLVCRLNQQLCRPAYDEATVWSDLTGTSVHQLWDDYQNSLIHDGKGSEAESPRAGGPEINGYR